MSDSTVHSSGTVPLDRAAARALFDRVLAAGRQAAPRSILVFDLDSTLLDNRPRQALIMREYGDQHGVAALAGCQAEHWRGWDPRVAMVNAGLSAELAEDHVAGFREYWKTRFFTSEYCAIDRPIAGAVSFVGSSRATGAMIAYVTGRHEAMRAGTVECFGQHGFATPDGERVHLLMKPTLAEHDDDYKARTYDSLRALGVVVAAFDNEPAHINGYFHAFPDAVSVHLATDHSLRDIPVEAAIPSVRDFSAATE